MPARADWLLNEVLKKDWNYPGYVMSDWGATHSTAKAANAGLDQESAYTFDKQPFFGAPLKAAVADGSVPQARLDDMAGRITRSMFAHGLFDHPVVKAPDRFRRPRQGHPGRRGRGHRPAEERRRPAARSPRRPGRSCVIGSHSDVGVLSGGGSSQVFPIGGVAVKGLGPKGFPGPIVFLSVLAAEGAAG